MSGRRTKALRRELCKLLGRTPNKAEFEIGYKHGKWGKWVAVPDEFRQFKKSQRAA